MGTFYFTVVLSLSTVGISLTTGTDYGPPTQILSVDSGNQETWQPLSKTVRHIRGRDSVKMLRAVRVEYFEQDGFKDIVCLDFTYADRANECPEEGKHGTQISTIYLDYDEYIVEIFGNSKPFISRIGIRTNNRELGVWGQPESNFHKFSLSNDEKPLLQVDLHVGVWLYDITCVFSDVGVLELRPTMVTVAEETYNVLSRDIRGLFALDNKYRPTAYFDLATKGCRTTVTPDSRSRDGKKVACQLKTLLEQLNLLTNSGQAKRDHQTVNLLGLSQYDTAGYLNDVRQSKQFHQLLANVKITVNKAVEVQVDTAQALGNYFRTNAGFEKSIAKKDVEYFNGRLDSLREGFKAAGTAVFNSLYHIVGFAMTIKTVEAAVLAYRLVQEMKNWVAAAFTFKFFEATASLRTAIKDVMTVAFDIVELGMIANEIKSLADLMAKIQTNYDTNKNSIKGLIDITNKFDEPMTVEELSEEAGSYINSYGEYNPEMSPQDVAQLSALLNSLVSSACKFVKDNKDLVRQTVKNLAQSTALENCLKFSTRVVRLETLFEESIALQFDLIDSLTAQVRSSIAERMADDFAAIHNTIDIGTCTIGTALVEVKYQAAGQGRCDVLEYINGGLRTPTNCKHLLLAQADLDAIEVYTGTISHSTHSREGFIKGENPDNSTMTYLDVDAMLRGEEVIYALPMEDTQWLKDHMWLPDHYEPETAFYVHGIEVFIPGLKCQEAGRSLHVTVHMESLEPNRLYKEEAASDYLVHSDRVTFNYKTQTSGCDPSHIRTYAVKDSRYPVRSLMQTIDSETVCSEYTGAVDSHGNDEHTFPSIYAQWKMRINGTSTCTLIKDPDYRRSVMPMVTIQLSVEQIIVSHSGSAGSGIDECWPPGSRCGEQNCEDLTLGYRCTG